MLHYREPSKSVKRTIAGMALAIVSLLALAACSSDDGDEVDRRLAESFLRNSPTFRFDGLPQSVELIDRADGDCETCVVYTFGFESSHPGYGDRTDLPLAAAVTPHEAIISIEDGLVTSARIDSIWDVIAQRPIARTRQRKTGRAPLSPHSSTPHSSCTSAKRPYSATRASRSPSSTYQRTPGVPRRPTASSQALRRYASTWSPGNGPLVCTSSSSISARSGVPQEASGSTYSRCVN